jgi:hypothetical protein
LLLGNGIVSIPNQRGFSGLLDPVALGPMRPTSKLTAALAIAGVLAGCAGTRGPGRVVVPPMAPQAEAYAAFMEGNLAQR